MFYVILYVAIICGCVVLDQVGKIVAFKFLSLDDPAVEIIGDYLGIKTVENRGMAYGMLGDWKYSQVLFCVLTVAILLGVLYFLFKTKNRSKSLHTAIAFMVGGTLGNFIDRLSLNFVRDFIALDLRLGFLQFNCNPADIFITVGAVLFVVYFLFLDKEAIFKKKKEA